MAYDKQRTDKLIHDLQMLLMGEDITNGLVAAANVLALLVAFASPDRASAEDLLKNTWADVQTSMVKNFDAVQKERALALASGEQGAGGHA